MKVLVIGDVIDDIIVVPSHEIRSNTDTESIITQTLGGSAGNIASWAAYAGADVTFLGCVNSSDAMRVQDQFNLYSVKTELQKSEKQTGKLVSIVEGANRTMLTDRGANQDLDFASISNSFLEKFGFVFLSGYSIFKNDVTVIADFLKRVNELGIRVMVDPGSRGFIEDYGVSNFKSAIKTVDFLLPNEDEFEVLGLVAPVTIVTKGANGVDYYSGLELSQSFEVNEIDAIDPTGAGDSFSGTVLAKLSLGESIQQAIAAGIVNAGKAVLTIGARPQL